MKLFTKLLGLGASGILALTGLAACTQPENAVTLDFFQFKTEAAKEFTELASTFEQQNPGIKIRVNLVPDADTAIRTLLVKGKTPDVLTLNGSGNFGLLAQACVFADLSSLPIAQEIKPAVQSILNGVGRCQGQEVNALPMANNASGILYNPDIFAKHGVKVPQTWDELIAAADSFKAQGVNLFYLTNGQDWTSSPALVNLAAQLQP